MIRDPLIRDPLSRGPGGKPGVLGRIAAWLRLLAAGRCSWPKTRLAYTGRKFRRINGSTDQPINGSRINGSTDQRINPIFPAAAILFIFTVPAPAQLVTISDTIYLADGSLANGRADIRWKQFTSGAGQTIAAGEKRIDFTAGVFSTQLEANTSATPAGLFYILRFAVHDRTAWTEFWVVPTGGPHTISTVRVISVPSPTITILLSQIAASGASSGQVPVFNGADWAPGTIGAGAGIDCSSPATLTLDAAGAVSVTGNACFLLDTFEAAAADDLTAVNCTQGQRFIFLAANAARTVVVKKTAGIESQADFSLDSLYDTIAMVCLATNTAVELSRSSGGN